jgi:uncharacterized protein YbaR (Trm112 family)
MSAIEQGAGRPDATAHALPAAIRSLLACPKCHGALLDSDGGRALLCRPCALAFPVRDGIPVMLLDEAVSVPS